MYVCVCVCVCICVCLAVTHFVFQVMGNRKIRVDVAEGEGGNQRRGFSDRSGRDEDRLDRSEGVSDWRAAPPREGVCVCTPSSLTLFPPSIVLVVSISLLFLIYILLWDKDRFLCTIISIVFSLRINV